MPTLVLFRDSTQSACGGASSVVGPHYCPLDETIYLDETFFDELAARFGAQGGDVAEAYVIAHEVGHHVQNVIGLMDEVRRAQQDSDSQAAANELSMAMELQADCYAGIWAYSLRDAGVFGPGEIDEAIDAAEAVGDAESSRPWKDRSLPNGGRMGRRPSASSGSLLGSTQVTPLDATRIHRRTRGFREQI